MPKSSNVPPEIAPAPRAAWPEDRPGVEPEASTAVDALWTVADVAAYLKRPTSAIYKMTARGAAVRIPHIHIGGVLRFRRRDVDRWLALLSLSNLDTLARVRRAASEVTHGYDP
jgi:excisionase family DNA binding protein